MVRKKTRRNYKKKSTKLSKKNNTSLIVAFVIIAIVVLIALLLFTVPSFKKAYVGKAWRLEDTDSILKNYLKNADNEYIIADDDEVPGQYKIAENHRAHMNDLILQTEAFYSKKGKDILDSYEIGTTNKLSLIDCGKTSIYKNFPMECFLNNFKKCVPAKVNLVIPIIGTPKILSYSVEIVGKKLVFSNQYLCEVKTKVLSDPDFPDWVNKEMSCLLKDYDSYLAMGVGCKGDLFTSIMKSYQIRQNNQEVAPPDAMFNFCGRSSQVQDPAYNCFVETCYDKCNPGELEYEIESQSGEKMMLKNEVLGSSKIDSNLCEIKTKVISYSADSSFDNKEMTCLFDRRLPYEEPIASAVIGTTLLRLICHGELYDKIALEKTKLSSELIQ